ncbi:Gfo/Idh/MocA family oxidoreductase [Martelella alba]|uniref:Gfo/Idh/MocA family oxidoreductase n=1 Tax=Martelella alba TaxID=2590451 RepID=A0A506U6F0_9HYPH|nr:Gfo/Idh/MocA family oxidoreductase [Martelella alba]TPW27487.1 Gfo/Idh/MocA family oxidoreductase [Martelella alba]
MSEEHSTVAQSWPAVENPRPIVIIGAGSIVTDAHLPAYRMAGFSVAGIYDINGEQARKVADSWDIAAFATLEDAMAVPDAIFDLALPPFAHLSVLEQLPAGSACLIQKPMGRDLGEATAILEACRARNLTAAVNFQLRFAPMMLAIRDLAASGALGEIVDAEMHANMMTPWHLWPFLKEMERVEILLHSIHYLDLFRHFLGDPKGIHARTLGHPDTTVSQSRTAAILDYDAPVRAVMSINHNHDFGPKFQDCSFRLEGTKAVAIATLGVNLNYPKGVPDELWFCEKGRDWQSLPLSGTWFPHAFIGTMSNLQRFVAGDDAALLTSVEDAWNTMALVEAAYESAAAPATPIKEKP